MLHKQWVNLFYKVTKAVKHVLDIEGDSLYILNLLQIQKTKQKQTYFWKDVFYAWTKIVDNYVPRCISDFFLRSSIWYNNNIRVGKRLGPKWVFVNLVMGRNGSKWVEMG